MSISIGQHKNGPFERGIAVFYQQFPAQQLLMTFRRGHILKVKSQAPKVLHADFSSFKNRFANMTLGHCFDRLFLQP